MSAPLAITVNGEPHDVAPDTTVAALLERLAVALDGPHAVEVNEAVVPRSRWDEHRLAPDDRVEIVTFVGGG